MHGHWAADLGEPYISPSGLMVAPPAQAFVQAASVLPFRELVVAADHLIRPSTQGRDSPPLISLEVLRDAVASSSARGAIRARAALQFARVGSESRMETILRLLMAKYGLDALALQVNVTDRQGSWIGRFDLVDLIRKLIIEYDGEQHRTSDAQYERDQIRVDRAREAGFTVLRFRRRQVLDEPWVTAQRIAAALDMPMTLVTGQLAKFFAE